MSARPSINDHYGSGFPAEWSVSPAYKISAVRARERRDRRRTTTNTLGEIKIDMDTRKKPHQN